MDKQAKCEWLVEFYTKAAAGGVVQKNHHALITESGWCANNSGPTPFSNLEFWRIKPVLKVIDLTPLMWSGLDCEFWNDDQQTPTISPLISMDKEFLEAKESYFFENCQPRMTPYIHYWRGESAKCPVPEGFEVRLHLRDGSDHLEPDDAGEWRWSNLSSPEDIIGIEFIAVIDTYTLSAQ
jgi:hypothetical protein